MGKISINRRQFLFATSGVCFGFIVPVSASVKSTVDSSRITAWVKIDIDNKITIFSPAAEMGQGSMTAIPMIFAEELDADWNQVSIEFSPADDFNFKNPTSWIHGIMLTLGSSAVSGYYDSVRLYGAQARKVLLLTAAKHWQVPIEELATEPNTVVHLTSTKRISYGDLSKFIDTAIQLPSISETELKAETDFRIIGSNIPRYDIDEKVTGSAIYSIDVDLPDMVFASVIHSPVNGGLPLEVENIAEIESRLNILRVLKLPDAIAIVALSYEAALKAEKEIQIQWSDVDKLKKYSDKSGLENHLQMVRDAKVKGMSVQAKGDVDSELIAAKNTWQAEYLSDYLYHAQMEPLNAVAKFDDNSNSVEIWVGTQAPTHCVRSVAKELGISHDKVKLNRTYLGGGFGRRGAQDHDFVIDAVRISKKINLPVKMIWSRESDVKTGRFKPAKAMFLQAGDNAKGRLTAWYHRTSSDEALKQSDPYRYSKNRGWPVISSSGMDIDYDIENILAEIIDPDTGVRASPLRGIGGTINKFASESFLDEIARAKNIDPLDLRLQLLHKHPVAQNTLNTVAKMANWKSRSTNSGLGLAFDSVYYPTAYVVKIEVVRETGIIRIEKVWVALDVGIAIHPENIIGQLEGQIIFAISNVLKERITFSNGIVDQSNFNDYPIMRMTEVPEIEVNILERAGSKPAGVGDSRLAAIPAAIANGFSSLTDKRLRHLPFIPERVKQVLSS